MAEDHSKQRKQAEAEFAKTQAPAKAPDKPTLSAADENTVRLKASRLARDAADSKAKDKGQR